ncbi:MAG: SMP-30/gluconolactonase/LRE family protein [Pirellulales bacterium]
MRFHVITSFFITVATITSACAAQDASQSIEGIGPTGEVTKLHTGFAFTEGPASDGEGNVYFTDIPNARIHKIDSQGRLTVFTDQSRHANGLMFRGPHEMIACEMDGSLAAWNTQTGERTLLVSGYQDKRFNAPNDLVIDQQGGIYFTDPHFRAPEPLPQGVTAVYYADRDGKVTRLIEDLPAPNGVSLSPDEKTLYVFPSGQAEMMSYPVEGPGKIAEGKEFCRLRQQGDEGNSGADGVTIDTQGNLYITSGLGLQVYNPQGEYLGVISVPEQPANVTFGGPDRKTLYVTARTSLYTIPMQAQGHVFGPREQ